MDEGREKNTNNVRWGVGAPRKEWDKRPPTSPAGFMREVDESRQSNTNNVRWRAGAPRKEWDKRPWQLPNMMSRMRASPLQGTGKDGWEMFHLRLKTRSKVGNRRRFPVLPLLVAYRF